MRVHHLYRHFADKVCVPIVDRRRKDSGVRTEMHPKCDRRGMQLQSKLLKSGTHYQSLNCREGHERKKQQEAAIRSAKSLQHKFTAYGEELERVDFFEYLGRLLTYNDTDMRTVRKNLKKARKTWGMLRNLLRGEFAPPEVCGMFYKAVIQSILLYGCETWVITKPMLRMLRGFHLRAAYRMAKVNKPRKLDDVEWYYPPSEDVFAEVKIHSIDHYIEKRRASIAEYVASREVFKMCKRSKLKRGSGHNKRLWWEQEKLVDLNDEEEEEEEDDDDFGE